MRVTVRADASRYIGYGHIMRCLTLAEGLTEKGASVSFVCREEEGNLIDLVRDKGYQVVPLPAGTAPGIDARLTREVIEAPSTRPDWLIVDHYGLGIEWESSVAGAAGRIMVIDDFTDRHHVCDILLNQNFGVEPGEYDGLVPAWCRRLTGTSYVLLRDQFRKVRFRLRPRSGEVKRIFLFYGGADPTGETLKAIEAIGLFGHPDIVFDVLVGESNPQAHQVEKACSLLPNVLFHRQVDELAPLMARADLAIGAGGSTTWERCSIGLPSIMTILAENQRRIVESLAAEGAVVNAGWYEDVTPSRLAELAEDTLADRAGLMEMSRRAVAIVDGEGVYRVVEEMLQ